MRQTIRILIAIIVFTFFAGLSAQENIPDLDPITGRFYRLGFGVPPQPVDAPDFSIMDLKGNRVSLSSFRGDVVLLNFWATWCPPCRAEMPAMEELYQALQDEGFTIMAVSTRDQRETREKVVQYIGENGYTFPVFFDETAAAVPAFYRTGSIPTSYVINKKGQVIARLVGAFDWNGKEVTALLKDLSAE
ncbi:TlpA disulfide reductase family protein [Marispirochaeta sp.]|jgi:thiol-disulfide isomerase/thioredoxin|uniref:TlpA disulfide reductase family protein n=1 Tax=Marispirochaeta sp. TaxID=2038653 RepID=UPI0029C61464|nr:TlpA disulfide reductase family protein [Marispirochaeta sp.]